MVEDEDEQERTSKMNTRVLIAGVALMAVAAGWLFAPSQAQGNYQPESTVDADAYQGGPLVSVSATGRVSSVPDRATVSVGTTAQAKDASAAMSQVSSTMSELIDELKSLDLPGAKIQTSSVQLYPVYGPNNGNDEPRVVGYRASNSVSVRTDDVERIADVLDLATRLGANQINGPTFELQDANGVQRGALREAVAEAKKKAQAIAEAMDMKIVRWEEISEAGSNTPRPMAYRGEAMMMSGRASTPIEAGEIETTATVTLVARLSE